MTPAICGGVGQASFTSTRPRSDPFSACRKSNASWELATRPLFFWMGEILLRTTLSKAMFEGLRPGLNRVPGRHMHATMPGGGIFGSVSRSSDVTCATISKVVLPEPERRGYDAKLALGALATAGTLGIVMRRGSRRWFMPRRLMPRSPASSGKA